MQYQKNSSRKYYQQLPFKFFYLVAKEQKKLT